MSLLKTLLSPPLITVVYIVCERAEPYELCNGFTQLLLKWFDWVHQYLKGFCAAPINETILLGSVFP